jgi:Flp pilus assembly protein TadG
MRSPHPPLRRAGTAATECALVLPLLLLIAGACIDLGRATRVAVVLSNAARCAAEAGALRRFTVDTRAAWETVVRDAADRELAELGADAATKQITITSVGDSYAGVTVTVVVSCDYDPLILWPGTGNGIRLERRATMFEFR